MGKLNFKISEFIESDVAKKNSINNFPDIQSLDNILNLIVFCMQPIRDLINAPVIITSGYRSASVNKLVLGANNSQHLTGQAADFIVKGMSPSEIIAVIKNSKIEFDQLINEYNRWVHVSYNSVKNRNQILKIL